MCDEMEEMNGIAGFRPRALSSSISHLMPLSHWGATCLLDPAGLLSECLVASEILSRGAGPGDALCIQYFVLGERDEVYSQYGVY